MFLWTTAEMATLDLRPRIINLGLQFITLLLILSSTCSDTLALFLRIFLEVGYVTISFFIKIVAKGGNLMDSEKGCP